ncbi:MAG: hypothetical protein GY737_06215, partial [Desulfobacteraceae bacterium]|nr:hypothetical protein [Desulfobacteraceae bacterium]
RIEMTVKCVQDGKPVGDFHIDAMVATDVIRLFDTYAIAGSKMKEKLSVPCVDLTDEDEPYASTSSLPSHKSVSKGYTNPPPHKRNLKFISKLYTLDHRNYDAIRAWSEEAECDGGIILQSVKDGKPRVTNVDAATRGMIRVGNWDHLEDSVALEAHHVALAKIRKNHPERICRTCDYLLVHECPDVNGSYHSERHCEECCLWMQLENSQDLCGNKDCGRPLHGHRCKDPIHVYLDCDGEDSSHGGKHCQDCCAYNH